MITNQPLFNFTTLIPTVETSQPGRPSVAGGTGWMKDYRIRLQMLNCGSGISSIAAAYLMSTFASVEMAERATEHTLEPICSHQTDWSHTQ